MSLISIQKFRIFWLYALTTTTTFRNYKILKKELFWCNSHIFDLQELFWSRKNNHLVDFRALYFLLKICINNRKQIWKVVIDFIGHVFEILKEIDGMTVTMKCTELSTWVTPSLVSFIPTRRITLMYLFRFCLPFVKRFVTTDDTSRDLERVHKSSIRFIINVWSEIVYYRLTIILVLFLVFLAACHFSFWN